MKRRVLSMTGAGNWRRIVSKGGFYISGVALSDIAITEVAIFGI
jgi:hypothetical protein